MEKLIRVLTVLVFLSGFGFLKILDWQEPPREIPAVVAHYEASPSPSPPPAGPTKEQLAFWNSRLRTAVIPMFDGRCRDFPELGARAQLLVSAVRARHGAIALFLATAYSPISREVLAASGYERGRAEMHVFIPAMEDAVRQGDAHDPLGEGRPPVEAYVFVLHELEHLALRDRLPHSGVEFVNDEMAAWAGTCEYAATPLVEKYHIHLDPGLDMMYRAWIEAHRNQHSERWRNAVMNLNLPALRFH